jgi:hypothetical protein
VIRRLFCHLQGWRKQGGAGVANLAPRNCVIPTPPFRGVGGWRGGASSRQGVSTGQGIEMARAERLGVTATLAGASVCASVRNICAICPPGSPWAVGGLTFAHDGYAVEMVGGSL